MPEDQKYLGYVKYKGNLVEGGLLDARKSAEALLGFDEIIRYFVLKERPDLRDLNFEIPVRIRKGSWEALIPESIGDWILTGGGIAAAAYFAAAAKKMAERDFADIGLKDVFQNALRSAQWMIRISKHIGTTTKRKFEKVKWTDKNRKVGIPNDRGEYLEVPKEMLDLFAESPDNLFSKNAALIEEERSLSFGVYNDDDTLDEVSITKNEKAIFYKEDEHETLFPELKHGQSVELEGTLTRGNTRSNNLGFEFQNHILNCYPKEGSIIRFKDALFLKVKITGIIDRIDEFGNPVALRPQIIIVKIVDIEPESNNQQLL